MSTNDDDDNLETNAINEFFHLFDGEIDDLVASSHSSANFSPGEEALTDAAINKMFGAGLEGIGDKEASAMSSAMPVEDEKHPPSSESSPRKRIRTEPPSPNPGAHTRFSMEMPSAVCTSSRRLTDIEVGEISPYVFHVRLAREQKRNTFTFNMWLEMSRIFDELSGNPKCRSIVLSGEGKSFCVGIDLQDGFGDISKVTENEELDVARKGRALEQLIKKGQEGCTAIERCVKPVVAAVHSHCIGAGIDMITACDIRYASKDAIFSIREVDVGLAADVGTLARIQRVVGNDSLTRELALTGRDFRAEEAASYGLVSKVLDDQKTCLAEAIKTAELIASKTPIAVQGTKIVLNNARNHSTQDNLDFVRLWNMSQLNTEDLAKAAMASMMKTKGEFGDV